jgi:hypothetical protein
MPQISLVNRSTKAIKVGDYVKLHPTFKDAFVFADYWDRELIGNATQQVAPGRRCVINLLNTVSWEELIGSPATFPPSSHTHLFSEIGNASSRVVTDTTTELTTDNLIVCNKAAAMTVNLLAATGSNRIRQIASINDGPVTVTPNGADTIDGEASQIVYKNSCMDIKDYVANKWVII